MENNKNKKSVKFQGDMLNFYDFIQVFIFTKNHHLKIYPSKKTRYVCTSLNQLSTRRTKKCARNCDWQTSNKFHVRPVPSSMTRLFDHCSHSGLVGHKLSRLYTQYCEEYIVRLHGCAGRSESFPGRICLTKRSS